MTSRSPSRRARRKFESAPRSSAPGRRHEPRGGLHGGSSRRPFHDPFRHSVARHHRGGRHPGQSRPAKPDRAVPLPNDRSSAASLPQAASPRPHGGDRLLTAPSDPGHHLHQDVPLASLPASAKPHLAPPIIRGGPMPKITPLEIQKQK